ncbi:O-antigen ligase [Allopseudospirillum japonicum]|uniref:O-antigen ligase n=1 Tax=Allopseudospirillum japonicum TaxID=64971 RepID=A0A1H6SWI9_9GAMM|nr:O-antigen ligase family protein [Allopseudospirillum japonicum]SEI72243.1 O-antigen ligase [Allopseudospirillum japonicum]
MKIPFGLTPSLETYTNLAVFLLGALCLALPSGYSIAAVLLLCASITLVRQRRALSSLSWQIHALMLALLAYWLSFLPTLTELRELDGASRFLLALPVFWFLLSIRLSPLFWWLGVMFGALIAGLLASWQKWGLGMPRAEGFTHVIQFGDLSLLLGILSLAGVGLVLQGQGRQRTYLLMFALLAGSAGLLASLLSGSRGGWIGLPFVAWVLWRAYAPWLSCRLKFILLASACIVPLLIYAIPQTGVATRIHAAWQDIQLYQQAEVNTSLGARFEMWQLAIDLIPQRPWLGWGETDYMQEKQALITAGQVTPVIAPFDHVHNDLLDATLKRGLFGLLTLLALYLLPIFYALPYLYTSCTSTRALATALSLIPITFIDFGLSQTLLAHHSGALMYPLMLVCVWALLEQQIRHKQDLAAS